MLTGAHYQNAYVTRNVDAAVERFRRHADIRLDFGTEVEVPLWTPAGEGLGRQKLAFIWIGDLQCELIQPIEGEVLKLYRDALPEDDSLVFHHICQRVEDWSAFQEKLKEQPFEVALRGGTPGHLEFCYLDTRDWLGHYTEYVWASEERWAQLGGR